MQASTRQWKSPAGVLGRILSETRHRVADLRGRRREVEQRALASASPPSFRAALAGNHLAVIAEIKRRSPSKGDINPTLTTAVQARAYTTGGASAISVLTEPHSFGGSLADLTEARRGSGLPLLRKDFIVDALQIAEARAAGASAVLLIARAVPPEALADLAASARSYGVEALVEIRTEDELDLALSLPVSVIGVNSRDLETLEVSAAVTAKLIPLIPSDRLAIAESGIATTADAVEASRLGADAVLVGSALSAASDPAALVHSLAAVPRTGRARRD